MSRGSQIDKDYKEIRTDTLTVDGVLTASGGIVGDVTGNLTGQVSNTVQELTASGAITILNGTVHLNHATVVIAATLPAPTVIGQRLTIIDTSATGTAAHTVTVPGGVTWDGTNDVATFNLLGEALIIEAISLTRWLVLVNLGSVGFS